MDLNEPPLLLSIFCFSYYVGVREYKVVVCSLKIRVNILAFSFILTLTDNIMPSLYTVSLIIVSAAHLLIGLGNIFKIPPYNPAVFLVADHVGTGDTGIEKLLEAIMAGWYTASIIGVLAAYITRYLYQNF